MNVVSPAAGAMAGLTVPAAPAGAAMAGVSIPDAATGGASGGTAGGTAGGAANGAANGATADPAVRTGKMTETAIIIAAAPVAMMQTSVSVQSVLLPNVLKQPMPVRKLIWVKIFKFS